MIKLSGSDYIQVYNLVYLLFQMSCHFKPCYRKIKSLKCFIFVVDEWLVYILYITTLYSSRFILYTYSIHMSIYYNTYINTNINMHTHTYTYINRHIYSHKYLCLHAYNC